MASSLSCLIVVIGAATARLAERYPLRTEVMETVAGVLLLGGFAAIGCALPAML